MICGALPFQFNEALLWKHWAGQDWTWQDFAGLGLAGLGLELRGIAVNTTSGISLVGQRCRR
jgi:hypothetical protein